MTTSFRPDTPLERLVHAGDYAGTLAFLRPLTEAERRRHGAEAVRVHDLISEYQWQDPKSAGLRWDSSPSEEQKRAAEAAVVLCGTPKAIAQTWVGAEHLVSLARGFSLSYLPQVAEAMLQRHPAMIRVVQPLVAERLIERPDSDEYVLGLIGLPQSMHRDVTLQSFFDADPGLKRALLRMFEVEGNADTSLASTEKYTSKGWAPTLLEICREGVFSREELLEKTLAALERDWPQYRSGWFSRFHEQLAPTSAEMAPHLERYLHLLGSRIPPTVSLALKCVSDLAQAGRFDAAGTLLALRPVLGKGNKQQVEAALRLLERCAPSDPVEACVLACAGLVTDSPPLQKKILQFVAKHASSADVAGALSRHGDGIAASNRPLFDSIVKKLGGSTATAPNVAIAHVAPSPVDADPLSESRRLPTVDSIEDLVELVAYAFENAADSDAFERAATSLVARHPFSSEESALFGPILKRAPRVKSLLPAELARLLLWLCRKERVPPSPDPAGYNPPNRALRLVQQRIDALIEFASRAKQLTPLATPTHRRGFIAPADLFERLQQHREAGVESPEFESELALLRLGPLSEADRARARALPSSPVVRALHRKLDETPQPTSYPWRATFHPGDYSYYSLHVGIPDIVGDGAIVAARHPAPKSDAPSYHRRSLCGNDPGVISYFGSLVPDDLEPFFAEGARSMGNNLDWWEACWQDKAYLATLMDSTVKQGEMATLALVCALIGKEPGQAAIAVDALVQAHRERRLDARLLAQVHSKFALEGLGRLARLRKSFDAALRIEPSVDEVVVEVIDHLLRQIRSEVPKDLAKLLELLNEIRIASGRELSSECREALSGMKLGGASVALRKSLLSRA
jgi:hypothetical protein